MLHWGESAASFCLQVVAWFPNMFRNFYLEKNRKIAKNSTTTKTREREVQIWNPQNFWKFLMYDWLNLKTVKFYLIKLATDF